MKIDVKIDNTQLVLRLRKGEKRLAYAAVNAINNTLKRIQEAERQHVESEFTIRRRDFIRREAAVVKPFANVRQGRPFGEIAVGQKPRLLLAEFEKGAERLPFTPGAQRWGAPIIAGPARPSFASKIVPQLDIRRLKFDLTKTGRRRKAVTETATYLIAKVGIFQRLGKNASRLVYFFSRGSRLKPRLHFVQIAEKEANRWFKEEMEREVVKAIQFSRGEGL